MSFNYQKNKDGHSQDSFWTSYSDLFLGLSTIFLLLYVVSSLRTGTDAIKSQLDNEKLSMKVQELENQLKMYESVKNDYLSNNATKTEQDEYQELMDKLTLLQEEAKDEKQRLVQQALENETKEKALNKYQQMVRNVLNANKVAKTKIMARDGLIKEQDTTIETKDTEIGQLQKNIQEKQQQIAQNEHTIAQAEKELDERMNKLKEYLKEKRVTKAYYDKRAAFIKAESDRKIQKLAEATSQIESQLKENTHALTAAQSRIGQLGNQLGQAQAQLGQTQNQLGQVKGQLGQTLNQLGETKNQLNATSGQLAQARQELEARKSIAGEIQKGFAKAGIKADINPESGDVILDFGQNYFDSDSDRLKAEMKKVLEKAMPIYSKSLFGNPKVASKISAVEVIGFASPTYQGRYIDPRSADPADKQAIKYNMDLSYRRANSIFSYLLDQRSASGFEHQKELVSLMKVSGRSFLEVMNVSDRNVASANEFCQQNDCKKAQRVIVRFSMDKSK